MKYQISIETSYEGEDFFTRIPFLENGIVVFYDTLEDAKAAEVSNSAYLKDREKFFIEKMSEADIEHARIEKEHEEELKKAIFSLSPREKAFYNLLETYTNSIEDAGVDTSYFPHAARMKSVEFAKKFSNLADQLF